MKKIITTILFVVLSCSGFADWNLNGDCVVNFADFGLFAADWDDPYDLDDLTGFASEWLTYSTLDRSPVAQSQTRAVFNDTTITITLSATDENSDPIQYSLLTLPTALQGTITGVSSVPHTLAGNTFEFEPVDTYSGVVTITFGADDQTELAPPCGGMTTATVKITVYADPVNPTANAASVNADACVPRGIALDAADDGWPSVPGKLQYIITSLPTSGTLLDYYNGYTVIDSVPYTLADWGTGVAFVSGITGSDTFGYKAFDGGFLSLDGYSNTATVTVKVAANLHDSLSFDGAGTVTFADHAAYDIVDGWAIDFWVKMNPGQVNAGLMKKRSGSGKGWEIGIVSGKLKMYLYDGVGNCAAFRSPWRIDDGNWHEVTMNFNSSGSTVSVYLAAAGKTQTLTAPGISDYSNNDPFVIGQHSRHGYRYGFDRLSLYSNINDPTALGSLIHGFYNRTSANEFSLGLFKASDVLFMFDEGTGAIVVDSKLGLIGAFNSSNHVKWTPPIQLFTDASAQQYQLLNGGGE